MTQIVRDLMRRQHKNMFEALREGKYDDLLDEDAASSSQSASRGASTCAERSPQSRTKSSQTVPSASPSSANVVSSIARPIVSVGKSNDEPQSKSARSPHSGTASSRVQPTSSAAMSWSRLDAGTNKPSSGAKSGSSPTSEKDRSASSGRYSFDSRSSTLKATNEATAPSVASSSPSRIDPAGRSSSAKPASSSSAGSGSVPSAAIFRPRPSVSRQQALFSKQADEEKSLDDIILGFLADEFGPDAVGGAGAAEKTTTDAKQSKSGGAKPRR